MPTEPPIDAFSDQRLESLQRLTDSALGYLSLEEMLSELLERIRDGLRADTAAVLLLDRERDVLVARAAKGIEEEVRQGVHVPLARGFAGRVAAQDRPIVIRDLDKAEVVNPLLRQRGIRSLLGVPLHVEGRVIGVLHVGALVQHDFTEEDVHLLQHAADRAALAIDNAQLSEQRAVTELMQRTMLPDALPEIPGLRFSAKYLPAGSGIRIGGDWYDVYQLPDGRVAFVIGDVVGRGVLAASVMAEARTALRAYLMEGHEPASAMSLINDLLISMGRHRSATAAIYALDVESEQIAAVNAGHLPALLLRADEQPAFVTHARAPPLGVGDYDYATEILSFGLESCLLLYTDGLIERRGKSIDEGLARLQAAAEGHDHKGELTLADHIYRELVHDPSLEGVPSLEDDIALLVIGSVPLGDSFELTLEAAPRVLAGLRRTIARWLTTHGVGPDERFDIAVAVSEAAGNAIEHAYGPHRAHFTVDCRWLDGEVRAVVRDSGRWRTPGSRGRGRGLEIMRELMDSVQIERGKEGTTITLVKRIAGSR